VKRVVVLGGAGNFGARIVRDLCRDGDAEVLVASRGSRSDPAMPARPVALDIGAADFAHSLGRLSPDLVIHCAGPFQSQDYEVVRASLAAGAHYLDLADGRDFVMDFAEANDALARQRGRTAICGASTLPALSSAVVDDLSASLERLEWVRIAIAPGQRAPRGVATLRAVFSYLGRPVQVWEDGRWRKRTGWMNLRRVQLAFGDRIGALCDVPDLQLFPQRHPGLRTVSFHAALEFALQHYALWFLAALRQFGVPLPVDHCAAVLQRAAGWFDGAAGPWGGMQVELSGRRVDGEPVVRTWQLTAPALHGPEIPCMAATLLARSILRGNAPAPGATPCMGLLTLADFGAEFSRWDIRTRIEERPA
jgi:hypothetical protein